jgi:3-phosphoshikimate 1-carboxyvinyltransferase
VARAVRRLTVAGELRPPGDKSITHRALMLAALARGTSELEGVLTSGDARSSARVLRQLGADVDPLRAGGRVRVTGRAWSKPRGSLDCGNSGTTVRLMLGLLAGHAFAARLTGDASLRRRPMRRVADPLRAMGARFDLEGDHLPLVVEGGPLRGITHRSPVASAQIKSAVLLAGLAGGVDVSVEEPSPSRDHTERLLRFLGAPLEGDQTLVRFNATSFPRSVVPSFRLAVPGDISSGIFPIAVATAADAGELTIVDVGLNPTRTGALRVLQRMGASLEARVDRTEGGEPVGMITVRPAGLHGTTVAPHEVPALIDEIPTLAVLAARATGETRFQGVAELRVKESDRLARIVEGLRAVGADAAIEGEDLIVAGGMRAPPRGDVETDGDHRVTMAFAVLGLVPGADVRLSETRSVAVSYPGFFDDLRRVTGVESLDQVSPRRSQRAQR